MTRTRTLALAALVALAASAPAHAALPKLTGTVGPGFTVSLKQGTKNVVKLKRGRYSLVVADRSPIHNFHLIGPGVNVKTTVRGTGTKRFTVTLKPGRYTLLCDPHPTSMKKTFRVS